MPSDTTGNSSFVRDVRKGEEDCGHSANGEFGHAAERCSEAENPMLVLKLCGIQETPRSAARSATRLHSVSPPDLETSG